MESFSLYDISATIYMKSTERIILPMVADLYHLIITAEWGEVNHEALTGLEKTAEELATATYELACIARRLAAESDDQEFKREMVPAAESLLISGKHIILVAQKLLIEPDADNCLEELSDSAKRILVETLKVLQTEDDAVVRRITEAAHRVLDCVLMLDSAEGISAMLIAFRSFSEALLLLTNQTERFLWDLKESSHQKHLAQSLQVLKNCIPMLHTAKLNNLKYPHDQPIKCSKSYIFDLARSTVKELISLLRKNVGTKKLHERIGLVPQHLHKLLGLLTSPQTIDLQKDKLTPLIEALVFYGLLLADSSRTAPKLKLVKLCHHLLKFRKVIARDVNTVMENGLKEKMEDKYFAMRAELENLNEAIHMAILYQILDSFAEIKGPLKRLVDAAMEPCSPAEKGEFLRKLRPLITVFFSHSSQMLKAAHFVLVMCTERETIQGIEECIDHLSRLLAAVPALLSKMSLYPGDNDISEKLCFLCQIWSSTTESLLICLDKVIDLPKFLDLAIQEMTGHSEGSEKALDNCDLKQFSWHASSLFKQAAQVVDFISRHVGRAIDPIFRNGLLVLTNQLENAIVQANAAMNAYMGNTASPQAKEEYSKRAKGLIESTRSVRMGLDACNQPDILSPLREGVRNNHLSKDFSSYFTPQVPIEMDAQGTIKHSSSNHSELSDEFSGTSLPVYHSSQKNSRSRALVPEGAPGKADLHPVIRELITATKTHNTRQLNYACSDLLALSNCCVDAAKEALGVAESPVSEKLLCYREIVALTPCLISLAREVGLNSVPSEARLLQTAILLSERIDEAKQCLLVAASSWYSLIKQLFCIASPSDFVDNAHMLDEIMEVLRTVTQLASKAVQTVCNKEFLGFPIHHEAFLQMKVKFARVQARTTHLLEKALAVSRSHSNRAKLESFDANCILWSVTIQTFLNSVDQFTGRDVSFLRVLQAEMKCQLCLQSTLAAVSESSLRIQEATRLSFLSCTGHGGMEEIVALQEKMKILTESLLRVAEVLSAPTRPAPNLSIHFELLQRELAMTVKVILLQLNAVNGEYLSSIQSVVGAAQLMPCDGDTGTKGAFEKNARQLVANIQIVKETIRDTLESPSFLELRERLLSTADHLLLLTDEVVGRSGRLQSELAKEQLLGDSILYEWSAKAGYLVRQLQATEGVSKTTLECIRRCLQNNEGHDCSSQHLRKTQPSPQIERESKTLQSIVTPKHRATETEQAALLARDINKVHWGDRQGGLQPSHSACSLRASATSAPGGSEKWWHEGCPVVQVTQHMTTQMSHMAQFLKRKGPVTTKEQLIACAMEIISGGHALIKFAGIIAKNCLDGRCASELLYTMEQTKTISCQLSILSRVNASTGRSRSSAEHLVSNAQNLIQATLQMLKAAEAACVKTFSEQDSHMYDGHKIMKKKSTQL
ncbi:Vinculin, partial [Varanus komodoensis]